MGSPPPVYFSLSNDFVKSAFLRQSYISQFGIIFILIYFLISDTSIVNFFPPPIPTSRNKYH